MGFLTSVDGGGVFVQQLLPPMRRLLAVLLVAALICVPAALAVTVAPSMPNNATRPTAIAAPATNTTAGSGLLTNEADRSLALNQTERFRRLIPYMTFYVPGGQPSSSSAAAGDYLPINQAYSYAPANQPKSGPAQQQQQQQQEEVQQQQQQQQQQQPLHFDDDADQHIVQQPHGQQHGQQPQQQHYHHQPQSQQYHQHAHPARVPYGGGSQQHHAPSSSSSVPAAAAAVNAHGPQLVYGPARPHPPQHATIVYKTRHQAHKPHKPYAAAAPQQQQQHALDVSGQQQPMSAGHPQQQPQRINYSYQFQPQTPQKKLTPFLSTNQIPGEFRPVQQQLEEFQLHQQQINQQQSYNGYEHPSAVDVYSPMAESDSDLPQPASHQVISGLLIQHKPTSDESASNQPYYQQQQPRKPASSGQLQQQQHQQANSYDNYGPTSSPSPPSYVQFIKAVTPTHQHQHQQTATESPHDIPSEAMPLLQSPHMMLPPMSHQAFGSPADHAASIGYHHHDSQPNKVRYNGFDYGSFTLDPNDGYERRVPTAQPPPARQQHHQLPNIAKGKYGGFSYRTTTATPFVASPTPFRPKPDAQPKYAYGQKLPVARPAVAAQPASHGDADDVAQFSFDHKPTQRPFEHQPLSYEHIRPLKRPAVQQPQQQRPTPVPASDVRQHLTETTHIDRPLVRPYHAQHRQQPQRQYQQYHQHPHETTAIASSTTAATPLVLPTRIIVPDELPETSPDYGASVEYAAGPEPNQHLDGGSGTDYADVLHKLQQSHLLPQRLNDGNIDVSIKSLVEILNTLKQRQQHQRRPSGQQPLPAYANEVQPQKAVYGGQSPEIAMPARRPYPKGSRGPTRPRTTVRPATVEDTGDYDYNGGGGSGSDGEDTRSGEDHHNDAEPPGPHNGRPGIDYPALAEIPPTAFNCKEQRYKGFFGDPETNCQVWHYCDLNGGQASFLCPNGTIFSQVALTCDWWFNVKCSTTTQLYVLNERLYKYILPFSPKFPEDYSGPVVDKYLAMKFAEMEEKMRREKDKSKNSDSAGEHNENDIDAPATSTEYDHHQIGADAKAAALLAATGGDGTQIDEEGQSHNVDSAIQYVDERDTVRVPHAPQPYHHSRPASSARLIVPQVNNHIAAATGDYEAINDAAELTSTELVLASSSIGGGDDSEEPATLSPPRTTMEPPLRDVHVGGGGGRVEVESERVELIEIKSDGSTGHLTPVGYR